MQGMTAIFYESRQIMRAAVEALGSPFKHMQATQVLDAATTSILLLCLAD